MTNIKTSDPAQLHLLLVAVSNKDAKAFRTLYESCSPKLFGFVCVLQNRELAEEVLQESFVNIWNNAGSYQTSLAAPMTWMITIVRNKAFDLLHPALNNGQVYEVALDGELFDSELLAPPWKAKRRIPWMRWI